MDQANYGLNFVGSRESENSTGQSAARFSVIGLGLVFRLWAQGRCVYRLLHRLRSVLIAMGLEWIKTGS